MESYNEEVGNNRDDDAGIEKITVADQVLKLFSSLNSLIGPFYKAIKDILKVEELNSSAVKDVKYCLETQHTSFHFGVLYLTALVVEESKKREDECIKSVFKNMDFFIQYMNKSRSQKVVADGWMRIKIEIDEVGVTNTCVFRCLAALLPEEFKQFSISNL